MQQRINSKVWLYTLVGLTALTTIGQYAMQGMLAVGLNPHQWDWLLFIDCILWAARALVEAGVIVFLFIAEPIDKKDKQLQGVLEFVLIAMITLTVGPALRAMGMGKPVIETMNGYFFLAWNFGIAAYTSIMIGATGFSYRVQTTTDRAQEIAEQVELRINNLAQLVTTLQDEIDELRNEPQQAQVVTEATASEAQQEPDRPQLNETQTAIVAQLERNGAMIQAQLAQAIGKSATTVSRNVKTLVELGIVHSNGDVRLT